MTDIHFTLADGSARTVQAVEGQSVMRASVQNGVAGIVGECGGELTCGTCHIYLETPWSTTTGPPSDEELELLEEMDGVQPESRLACQILVTRELDGLRCRVSGFQ